MDNTTKKEEVIKEAEVVRENPKILEKKSSDKSKNRISFKIWVIIILGMFLSSILGGFFGFMAGGFSGVLSSNIKNKVQNKLGLDTSSKVSEFDRESLYREESAIIEVVEKNSPAVVNIVITKDVPVFKNNGFNFFFNPFGYEEDSGETEKQKVGGGTGFFVGKDGMIVTNKHVVSDEAADYTVITTDEKEYKATVLARHPSLDIAIIKIDGDNFPVLNLGDSDVLKVGQSVIAIGNSLGEFSNSVSLGIVSGLKRDITAGSGYGESERLTNIIQTDAAINPGNSGGPLLDIRGNVIGINVAVAQGVENIGFALSVNDIKKTIEQVKRNGKISIPFLGIRYIVLNDTIQKENSLPYNYGALISRGEKITDFAVIPGSPADKAGLVENDIILEINDKKVATDNQINNTIAAMGVGDKITLKVWHKGNEKNIEVTLEERR